MIENTNIDWVAMTDNSIISAIGNFIRHKRLEQNKTQAQIATRAGINRWTLSQVENGESVTLVSLIQILRALDLLYLLNIFKIEIKSNFILRSCFFVCRRVIRKSWKTNYHEE